MKKVYASMLALASLSFAFWFNINPQGAMFCPKDASGNLVPYTVDRLNDKGETVTLSFGGLSQSQWCSHIAENPAR